MSSTPTINLGTKLAIAYSLEVALEVALEVIVCYAFGTDLRGSPYAANSPYRYAYHSYDCALLSPGTIVTESDVYASVGINSGISAEVILRVKAILDHTPSLPDLSRVPDLWTLDVGRLNSDPGVGVPEHALWQWYRVMTDIDGVGGAVASKVVHHRYPTVMPLWDSFIGKAYNSGDTWGEICQDLTDNDEAFEELERLFSIYLNRFQGGSGVALKRLRLLDILVWSDRANHRSHLRDLGRAVLSHVASPSSW